MAFVVIAKRRYGPGTPHFIRFGIGITGGRLRGPGQDVELGGHGISQLQY